MDHLSGTSGDVEVRVTVRGDVQGVGYRWFARASAVRCGVTGCVRNLADGSVEVEARGAVPAIRTLIAALREGPPHARVRDVYVEPRASSDSFHATFTIIR